MKSTIRHRGIETTFAPPVSLSAARTGGPATVPPSLADGRAAQAPQHMPHLRQPPADPFAGWTESERAAWATVESICPWADRFSAAIGVATIYLAVLMIAAVLLRALAIALRLGWL